MTIAIAFVLNGVSLCNSIPENNDMPARKKTTTETLAKGDHVSWNTPQGMTHGIVEKKLTSPTNIKTHHVSASPENPEYLVRSDKSDGVAAHKPGSLRKSDGGKKAAKKSATKATKTSVKKVAKKPATKAAKTSAKKAGKKRAKKSAGRSAQ